MGKKFIIPIPVIFIFRKDPGSTIPIVTIISKLICNDEKSNCRSSFSVERIRIYPDAGKSFFSKTKLKFSPLVLIEANVKTLLSLVCNSK